MISNAAFLSKSGRWLSFQDLEEEVQSVSPEEVVARIELKLGGGCRPTDVVWFAPFSDASTDRLALRGWPTLPGQRYPDWTQFDGGSHHLLVFGPAPDAEELTRIDRRWSKLVEISHNPHVDPARAGVPTGGMVLILPDSHIGFRFPSANAEALTTLDRHLSSYLVPDPVCA